MTEQRTEYGYRTRNGADRWVWHGSHLWLAEQIESARRAQLREGHLLIRRTVTYGPVEVVPEPLAFPTTPGSVILADRGYGHGLYAFDTNGFWVQLSGSRHHPGALYDDFDLTLIEVKYDAGKIITIQSGPVIERHDLDMEAEQ